MLSLLSLSEDVYFGTDRPHRDLGQLRLNVVSEASKSLDVHGTAGSNVLIQILHEGFPDDQELRLGLQRF